MEWLIGVAIVGLILLCPLMMIGMIVGGWILSRKANAASEHQGGHSGHGMMCMMHGGHVRASGHGETSADQRIAELEEQVRELRDERERKRERAA